MLDGIESWTGNPCKFDWVISPDTLWLILFCGSYDQCQCLGFPYALTKYKMLSKVSGLLGSCAKGSMCSCLFNSRLLPIAFVCRT